MILVDTLRADKLGCYGNKLGLTPRIDQFAAQGCLFEKAYSHAPWTLPSTASLLTSLYPAQHGAGSRAGGMNDFLFDGITPGVYTLAESFYNHGYSTAAEVSVLFLAPKYGLNRGFQTYDYR
ncbi:MAG TPA: sulfatase-like hydrolase/transferase, partial [Phycisphaerae bacterium]|nr:sulfatase-like hydrolase/transferase [Phycisphaerae bacterium]